MVTKILNLLDNPLLSDSFRQAIKEVLEGIFKDHSNDLNTQKKLFDEIIITIDNQVFLEENKRKLEEKLVELVETEKKIAAEFEAFKDAAQRLEAEKSKLELLCIGIDPSKITVEA